MAEQLVYVFPAESGFYSFFFFFLCLLHRLCYQTDYLYRLEWSNSLQTNIYLYERIITAYIYFYEIGGNCCCLYFICCTSHTLVLLIAVTYISWYIQRSKLIITVGIPHMEEPETRFTDVTSFCIQYKLFNSESRHEFRILHTSSRATLWLL